MSEIEISSGDALRLWHKVSLALVLDGKQDLSQRQLAILLVIYMEKPPHTVRGLAARLNVTKPVITRALDTMGRMKLVQRRRDENDRRNVVIGRTLEGSLYLEQLADLVSEKAGEV